MANYQVNQKLSDIVYGLKKDKVYSTPNYVMVSGSTGIWKLVSPSDVMVRTQNEQVQPNEGIYSSSGYAGAVYVNDTTKEVIIVNAGTDHGMDFYSDTQMALGFVPDQYAEARRMAQEAVALASSLGYSVSVTGHSLGGALSQLVAVEFGIPATTFNAYGVKPILDNLANNELAGPGMNNLGLYTSYTNGNYNSEQILNFKRSGDIIGNINSDVGITATVTSEGSMLTTVIDTIQLMAKDGVTNFIVSNSLNQLKNLGNLLAYHGIAGFELSNGKQYEVFEFTNGDIGINQVGEFTMSNSGASMDLTYTGSTWGSANSSRFSDLINFANDNLNNNGSVTIMLTDKDVAGGIDGLLKARENIYQTFGDVERYKITEQSGYINGISFADGLLKNIKAPWSLYRSLLTNCKRRRSRLHGIFNLV